MTVGKHLDSALARVLFAVRLKKDKTGAWGLVSARHKCAAGSARNLAKDGYDVCILDALTYVGAESQTHWLPLIDADQLDSLELRDKFAAQRAEKRQTKGCQMLHGMVTLTDEAVVAAAARLKEWCELPCTRGNFARQWFAVIGQPGVELYGGQDAWIAKEFISRIWVEREAGATMLLEKGHADIGVTLEGDGPEYIDSVARAIPGEVKVITKERGYDDPKVPLKHGHTLDELMHGKKQTTDKEGSKGEKYLQLVVQEVGDNPLEPDVMVVELKALVEGEEMYATGGYPLEVLDTLPTSVPTIEDHTSGALYVLVQDPSGGEAQPWNVRGDKWVRGSPPRARGLGRLTSVDRRLLRRCALNNMRGTAIRLAASDHGALARMMRAASTAQPEELSTIAELQWGIGSSRNAHNQAMLKAATKLRIESMLARGNYVTEAKEHFGVIVDGRTLTVCTAACSKYTCQFRFVTDRGHSKEAAPLPFGSPDMVLVSFSGDALKTKAWELSSSAGGMLVESKAVADKAAGAARRSNPLTEVFCVVPLHADVWAGFDAPPGQWPGSIAADVKHFAEFEGGSAPLELSKQRRGESDKLGEAAADLVLAGMCSLEELPKMVALCASPSSFKTRVAAIKAARASAQAAALARLAKVLEAQGREAVQAAGKRGLVLERRLSAKSGFFGVGKFGGRPGWNFNFGDAWQPGTFATREEAAVARAAFAIKARKPKPKPPAKGVKRPAPAAGGETQPSEVSRRIAK